MSVLHAATFRWTVAEYEELGRTGILGENDRVELLNGEIVVMSPSGDRHAAAVNRLTQFFVEPARRRYTVAPGSPFVLDEYSKPQPDVCLVDVLVETQGQQARAGQVYLVIEVADSSLNYDRGDKGPAYARNGVGEYWLLNLADNILEIYREPASGGYRETRTLGADERIAPRAFPDLMLQVGDFIP